MERIADNLARVLNRIEAAARRSGRSPDDVALVAVSKGVDAGRIREAWACGQRRFGENRVQELVAKVEALAGLGDGAGPVPPGAAIEWHMVGHLQRNKVRLAVRHIAMLHSLDSVRLAEELDRQLQKLGRSLDVLVEVNTSGEPTKFGVAPEEAPGLVREVARLDTLRLVGLMTVGPNTPEPEPVRRAFRTLRELRDRLRGEGAVGPEFRHLSMGMSSDFELAVEEGATLVRIGTAVFGPRSA